MPPARVLEETRDGQLKKSKKLMALKEVHTTRQRQRRGVATLSFLHSSVHSSVSNHGFAGAKKEKVEKYSWEQQAQASSAGHQLLRHSLDFSDPLLLSGRAGAGCSSAAGQLEDKRLDVLMEPLGGLPACSSPKPLNCAKARRSRAVEEQPPPD